MYASMCISKYCKSFKLPIDASIYMLVVFAVATDFTHTQAIFFLLFLQHVFSRTT